MAVNDRSIAMHITIPLNGVSVQVRQQYSDDVRVWYTVVAIEATRYEMLDRTEVSFLTSSAEEGAARAKAIVDQLVPDVDVDVFAELEYDRKVAYQAGWSRAYSIEPVRV